MSYFFAYNFQNFFRERAQPSLQTPPYPSASYFKFLDLPLNTLYAIMIVIIKRIRNRYLSIVCRQNSHIIVSIITDTFKK